MPGYSEFTTRFARDLLSFLKSRPGVDLESLSHSTPEMSFDLSKARENQLIRNRAGDRIFITNVTGIAYIRFNSATGSKYQLRVGSIATPFQKLYLENEAQAGKAVSIIIGYGAFIDFFTSAAPERLKMDTTEVTDEEVASGATYDFLSLSSQFGYLKEALIISPSTDFSVIVNVDSAERLNKTYTQYNEISEVVKDIAAFEKTDDDGNPEGKYIVHLKNISFKESIIMQVKNDSGSPITFEKLFCKYETS